MSRSRGNISERLARAKARIIFNKYKDEEERTTFLKSKYNFFVKLIATLYILFSMIIFLDLFLPSFEVEDKIISVRKTSTSSVSRHSRGNRDTFWELNFENAKEMEMYYSKYFHIPVPGDDVKIEFSSLLKQPKSIYLIKWGEKFEVVSSVFSTLRLIVYSVTLIISIVFLLFSKRAYQILANATFGFITFTMVLFLLTLFTK